MKALPKPTPHHHLSIHLPLPSIIGKIITIVIVLLGMGMVATWIIDNLTMLHQEIDFTKKENSKLAAAMDSAVAELDALKHEDQYVRNNTLQADITSIETTYLEAVKSYEDLLKLKEVAKDTKKFDDTFANILVLLSKRNYDEADKILKTFAADIQSERDKIAATFAIPANAPASNTPPGSGFSQQAVTADVGTFLVDIISGDLGSTRVIVDTASSSDCHNDCPVLALGDYVARNGAYAGINGSYFCPTSYPSCADRKNSFDTLLMNKDKVYFNSDNNVYSTVPAVIFLGGSVRWVGRSLEWGRDTSPDSVIANQPMLMSSGNIVFGGDDDPKKGSKGPRSFVASRGNTVYIGVVFNATVAEVAHVLKALGMENAINLDSGGSTALWHGGYKVGPGRNIPNAILFIRK